MSKFFHLAKKEHSAFSRQIKKVIMMLKSLNLKIIYSFLATLIVFFGVGYLIQVNSLATQGYQIKELEKKIADLKQEKSDLELEALSLQSLGSIKDKLAQTGMVAEGHNDYLAPTPVALAR